MLPDSAAARLPVLLALDATGTDPEAPEVVAALLATRIGRPVVSTLGPEIDEPAVRARLAAYAPLPRAGWAGARCAESRRIVDALAHDGEAHYRLVLHQSEQLRAAHPEELASVSTPRRLLAASLRAVGAGPRGEVREVHLDGELVATTYRAAARTQRIPIHHVAREVAPLGPASLDLEAALAPAMASLDSPPSPQWDALGRAVLARGCRLAALAIYDARLRYRPASRGVLRAALGRGGARAEPPPSRTEAGAAPAPPPAAPRPSCESLCELHIVELCNNDRDLWSRHHRPWESTPCGQMRGEPFLRACYQRQWLSGTLQDACIAPCRQAPEGRARLLQLLQSGGCSRTAVLPAS